MIRPPELRPILLRHYDMEKREVRELAAILIAEYGCRAVAVAAQRQAQYARWPRSEIYQLWNAIAAAARQMLRRRRQTKRAS